MNWSVVTSVVTALTAVGALMFTGLSLNATRDQVTIAEQGQVTDRYTKAVEQLGKTGGDYLQVRLGAIYALERLARDSPRDQPTIIEVLSAFIRTSSAVPTVSTPQLCRNQPHDSANQPLGSCRELHLCQEAPPALDVQAALTVLGRRNTAHDNRTPVDLRGTCLRRAQLNGANLAGARLDWTNLLFANLSHANLANANLSDAYLGDATFIHANLTRADLSRAFLFHAFLSNATLADANLARAELGLAKLDHANLTRADLTSANLAPNADAGAPYAYVDLSNANLADARLDWANLTGANLRGTNLVGVSHSHTTVTEVRADTQTLGKWW